MARGVCSRGGMGGRGRTMDGRRWGCPHPRPLSQGERGGLGEARARLRRAGHGMPCAYTRCGLLGWVRVEANPCGAAPPVFALCPWWRFPYRAGGGASRTGSPEPRRALKRLCNRADSRYRLHAMLCAGSLRNGANSVPTCIVTEKEDPLSSMFFRVSCVLSLSKRGCPKDGVKPVVSLDMLHGCNRITWIRVAKGII